MKSGFRPSRGLVAGLVLAAPLAAGLLVGISIVGRVDEPPPPDLAVSHLPELHGLTRGEVLAKLGEPLWDKTYPMSQAIDEFHMGLQRTYPLTNPANATVEIEEMTWQRGEYYTALWLHKVNGEWRVLDSCRWHREIVF